MPPIYFARVIKSNNPSFRPNEFIRRYWDRGSVDSEYHYSSGPIDDALIFLDEINLVLTKETMSLMTQLKEVSAACPNIEFELVKYEVSK